MGSLSFYEIMSIVINQNPCYCDKTKIFFSPFYQYTVLRPRPISTHGLIHRRPTETQNIGVPVLSYISLLSSQQVPQYSQVMSVLYWWSHPKPTGNNDTKYSSNGNDSGGNDFGTGEIVGTVVSGFS